VNELEHRDRYGNVEGGGREREPLSIGAQQRSAEPRAGHVARQHETHARPAARVDPPGPSRYCLGGVFVYTSPKSLPGYASAPFHAPLPIQPAIWAERMLRAP
jgi:hypothetical protein